MPLRRLSSLIVSLAAYCIFVGLPVWGIAMPMPRGFIDMPMQQCYVLLSVLFAIAGALRDFSPGSLLQMRCRSLGLLLACLVYGSLYLASAILCPRLRIGVIPMPFGAIDQYAFLASIAGSVLFFYGLRWGVLSAGRRAYLAYPQYLGILLFALGIALAHRAWLPLLALPGLTILFIWHTQRQALIQDSPASRAKYKVMPLVW